jgi:opacity protein-like surface antigen
MARRARLVSSLLCGLLSLLLLAPTGASAEGLLDVFAGAAFTPRNDVDVSDSGASFSDKSDFKTSFTAGARGGYWFGFFGVNLDLAYFRPEFDPDDVTAAGVDPVLGPFSLTLKTDLDVVAVGLNAMVRGQFVKDTGVPEGRLQPYIFGGPSLFISRLDVEATATTALGTASDDEADTSTKVGFTAGAGLAYMFTNGIGIFGEYRFTYNRPEFKLGGIKIEPHLDTHHVLGGLTLRF